MYRTHQDAQSAVAVGGMTTITVVVATTVVVAVTTTVAVLGNPNSVTVRVGPLKFGGSVTANSNGIVVPEITVTSPAAAAESAASCSGLSEHVESPTVEVVAVSCPSQAVLVTQLVCYQS
jgi:hypothetical protein